ncbi:MAG TPA: DNA-directed RNA polymerase subunit beta [Rickettsiales bacterium]|nr:DNA-directed RNA polymerase subunit beta [Rickettsiales bacterium]
MTKVNHSNYILRKKFSEKEDINLIPELVFLQKESYEKFLGKDLLEQADSGLSKAFKSFFPLSDLNKTVTLDFVSYRFGEAKYTAKECLYSGRTYSAPLYATLRLILWDDGEEGKKSIKLIKEQEVFLCDIPLMTDDVSFIFSGIERVIISQMRRAPGVFFDLEDSKISNAKMYVARVIPMVGSWLDMEFDIRDNLFFRLDRKRKMPITTLLRAMGMNLEEILKAFYRQYEIVIEKNKYITDFDFTKIIGKKFEFDIINANTNEIVIPRDTKLTKRGLEKIKASGFEKFIVNDNMISSYVLVEDVINKDNGEVILSAGTRLTQEKMEVIKNFGLKSLKAINPDVSEIGNYIYETSLGDKNTTQELALYDIYKSIRIGDSPTSFEQAEKLFNGILFSTKYDLSDVGRMKINHRLGLNIDESILHLTKEDIISIIYNLSKIKHNEEPTDDIDNLANRRLRVVGELVENQFRIGMARIERGILEKMNNVDPSTIMPQNLINSKPLAASINDFFATSQLSQFMDQTNPLSALSHKRRISSLGPGGLTRERAGFEVRDIHYTHYGKICPIETPEGQNIGLVSNMALFAKTNKYGFINTPYKKVENGVITDEVVYLSAIEEDKYTICGASVEVDKNGKILNENVVCRIAGNYENRSPMEVNFIEVSTRQIGSVATNLIPFVESDDAKRSLLASNMMRQAVPFVKPEMPLIGTGLEHLVAYDCGAVVKAKRAGIVRDLDSSRIVVEVLKKNSLSEIDIYELDKFVKTNNDTSINQRPLVEIGDKVEAGQVITDAQCVKNSELSLGKNVLVGFLPWDGYNFKDSIVISERLVSDDVFTSIHIEEFEVIARDTRLGPEEITRDIPNVGEDVLRKLDESGIIHIGAEIRAGDILVGKTTPKSESPSTPEEKLLKVIFGEKASDVKDTSLYVSPGVLNGTVIDVRVFTRQGLEKDERAVFLENQQIEKLLKDKNEMINILKANLNSQIINLVEGFTLEKSVGELKKGEKITKTSLKSLSDNLIAKIVVNDAKIMDKIEILIKELKNKTEEFEKKFSSEVLKIKEGEDLNQGVLKIVKVLVATKQKLQPGDKMAGRHGNKGVISRVLPIADMPYMEDGTPIDILLTPCGVPSRMSIGQVLETHLGWASVEFGKQISKILDSVSEQKQKEEDLRKKLLSIYDRPKEHEQVKKMSSEDLFEMCENFRKGVPFATGSFENIKIEEIEKIMENSGVDKTGQVTLFDGRTGEAFERPVTVGYMYMLKLHHLVDTKIHARSIGPYSLITQQPLGGKSHFGGQRFGEMECWALQGYGAAYTLQEMLTVKSDDVLGRVKIYESIIQGSQNFTCGVPESFNVMVKEVRSLGLNIELIKE